MSLRVGSALIALCIAVPAFDASAAVLFSDTQTGAQLAINPAVSFPTVTPSVNGTSLDFGTGSPADVLARWVLLPAGPREAIHVEITLEYAELRSDNDPRFGISDGSNWQGGSRTDQGFFTSQWASHDATTVTAEFWSSWCESLGAHVPTEPIHWETHIAAGGAGPGSMTNYQEGTGFCAGPVGFGGNELDEDQAISFLFYRDFVSGTETYRINSITIVVSDDSPPSPSPIPALSRSGVAVLIVCLLGCGLRAFVARESVGFAT